MMAEGWYFVRWLVPGGPPRGSQTFATLRACREHARRTLMHHSTWTAEIIRQDGVVQTVVEETR